MCPSGNFSDIIYTDLYQLGINFSTQNEDHNNYICDNVKTLTKLFLIYKSDFFPTKGRPISVRLSTWFTDTVNTQNF